MNQEIQEIQRIQETQMFHEVMRTEECKNLKEKYEEAFRGMEFYTHNVSREFNSWDLRKALQGKYSLDCNTFLSQEVQIKGVGQGTIMAYRVVGGLILFGVEYPSLVKGGHCLEERTEGIQGRDGQCRWVLPQDIHEAYF